MERCIWGAVSMHGQEQKKSGQEHLVTFFFFYRFQRSKHSTWWKKGRSKIESNRGMETTGSKHTRPFVALYILSICSTLLDGAKLCPLFYFETFFILSSRAEKFSSIACRFSFIVCWTWWGEKWNMTEKKQSWSRLDGSHLWGKRAGDGSQDLIFSVCFTDFTYSSELCLSHLGGWGHDS